MTDSSTRGARWLAPLLLLPCATTVAAMAPAVAARIAAASTAAHIQRACIAARPFYWEIGDSQAALASGSEGAPPLTASTTLPISTASEWIFGAYVVQLRGLTLSAQDVQALTMRSGYTNLQFERCVQGARAKVRPDSVRDCFHSGHLTGGSNADYRAARVDRFFYNGGHFQQWAVNDPHLASLSAAALTAVIGGQLGTAAAFSYDAPALDAGIRTTPGAYAGFLRRILSGQLLMHDRLGADAVCTNPSHCRTALSTPLPQTEDWHYSLGHWVEDDPRVGDGAFSDPGLRGFYPWIDAGKSYYGVVARFSSAPGAHVVSMQCGRLIRKAWLTGTHP